MKFEAKFHMSNIANQLTIIIPFLNEGPEIEYTLENIRATTREYGNVPIILINDASDDSFDYYEISIKYNAKYIVNKERIGVAASRDLGVKNCTTNFFLLLDGHMRFYDDQWLLKLNRHLERFDDTVLCCQSIPLYRNNNGELEVSPARGYGAMLKSFQSPTSISDIFKLTWNYVERNPLSDIEEIPCVLGAAYATSTKYWSKILGLQGLKQYGGDELYLSIKTWLSGGKCILVKDIQVGHIYRTKFPYSIDTTFTNYNTYFIVNMLFPTYYKILLETHCKFFLKEDLYQRIYWLYLQNGKELEKLEKGLNRVKSKDFSIVEEINNIDKPKFNTPKTIELHTIIDLLIINIPHQNNLGIQNGQIGAVLLIFHYANIRQDRAYQNIGIELLNNIIDKINDKLPLNFENGLLGIGWTIDYLIQNNLLHANRDEILENIDLQVLNVFNSFNEHILKGDSIIEFLYYISIRLSNRKKKLKYFNSAFLDKVLLTVENVLKEKSYNKKALWQIEFYSKNGFLSKKSSIADVINFQDKDLDINSISLCKGLAHIGFLYIINETDIFI